MAYQSNRGNLPYEKASKLGHLEVIDSKWVNSLVNNFEAIEINDVDINKKIWNSYNIPTIEPLKRIWVVDGSISDVTSNPPAGKNVAFIKTALLSIDIEKLNKIDKKNPHPLLLQDIMKDSANVHATVLPLKNVKTDFGNNYDSVRNIIYDSMRIANDGVHYDTLKWLAYKKWNSKTVASPKFFCPHCHEKTDGLPYDNDENMCSNCGEKVFLTDMIGFHIEMEEDSASSSVASSYMLIMETLMLFTAIRIMWEHSDKSLVSNALFIKDGPLTLRSQYSKLVPNIREFIEYTKKQERPVYIIGQEKSGTFFDHLSFIAKHINPKKNDEKPSYAVLSHEYVSKEVYRRREQKNPYGSRTNWGEKVFVKLEPGTQMVINVPVGIYNPNKHFPKKKDLIGFDKIMATLPSLISRKYEGALFPIELANGVASLSSYPSAKVFERFLDGH